MVESPIIASPPMPPRNPESRFASPIDHTTDGVCAGVLTNEVTTSVVIKPCTTPAMARRRPLPTTCAGARVRALVGGRGRQGGQSGRQAYLYAHARVWVWVGVGEGGGMAGGDRPTGQNGQAAAPYLAGIARADGVRPVHFVVVVEEERVRAGEGERRHVADDIGLALPTHPPTEGERLSQPSPARHRAHPFTVCKGPWVRSDPIAGGARTLPVCVADALAE